MDGILKTEDALNFLRVDDTEENTAIVDSLIMALPSYIEVTTGYSWGTDPFDPMVETYAKFVLTLWYNPDGLDAQRYQRAIDSLGAAIRAKVAAERAKE